MWFAAALIVCAILFFKSPLSGALADAIRHNSGVRLRDPRADQAVAHMTGDLKHLTEELSQLREQFSELAERVDFTERALAEVRRRDALPNPRT